MAMLLLGMVFMPAACAQETSKVSDKPSELEQGLIDALNSNAKNLPIDSVVANYAKANKDQISKSNYALSNTASGKKQSRTYQLKDGSSVTFDSDGFFSISSIKEEPNTKAVMQANASTSSTTTNIITTSHTFYNWVLANIALYKMSTKGYFSYNGRTVTGHLVDAWYVRYQPAYWQVSDWKSGVINYSTGTRSDIYGKGYFQFGILVNGIGLSSP